MDFPPFVHGMSSTVITSYADGVAGLSASPTSCQGTGGGGETGRRIREGTEPEEKIFPMQILFRFLPLSVPPSLFLPLSFQTATPSTDPAGSSLRIVGQLELSRIIHVIRETEFHTNREKQERERERINEF